MPTTYLQFQCLNLNRNNVPVNLFICTIRRPIRSKTIIIMVNVWHLGGYLHTYFWISIMRPFIRSIIPAGPKCHIHEETMFCLGWDLNQCLLVYRTITLPRCYRRTKEVVWRSQHGFGFSNLHFLWSLCFFIPSFICFRCWIPQIIKHWKLFALPSPLSILQNTRTYQDEKEQNR